MAKKPSKEVSKKPVKTLRDSANAPAKKKRSLKAPVKRLGKPLIKAKNVGKKEYYLPTPDNKVGKFLNKRRSIVPRYFRESWQEIKLVTWPDRKQTIKLTTAVLMFAIVFGVLVAIIDYGLDKVFRQLLL